MRRNVYPLNEVFMNDPFAIKAFDFPDGFVWGASTAGHQIEGDNIHCDRYAEEIERAKTEPHFEVSGKACNSYSMWRDDINILSELHCKMYRMSMEWSRIQPQEGVFVESELKHYIEIFEELKARGIKLCLTLIHFTVPQWFGKKGGLANAENLPYFERYLEYVVPKVAPYVDMWCVLNEINLNGADFKFNAFKFHARGYHIIKKYSDKPVSSAHALVMQSACRRGDRFDEALVAYDDALKNEFFFHAVRTGELVVLGKDGEYNKEFKNTCDYWAVNTYIRDIIDARRANGYLSGGRYSFDRLDMLPRDFYLNGMDAECVVHNVMRLTDKPIFITENGCSCDDDDFRKVFIVEYLAALAQCIGMGADVKGYLYWSLMDNYEWGSYMPKFGLVSVDRDKDFARTVKQSGYLFRDIIDNNGYKPEFLQKCLKALPRVKYGI